MSAGCWRVGWAKHWQCTRLFLTVLLLLFPMNLLPLMTVHIGSIDRSSLLASGLVVAWRQGWPVVSIVLA